MAKAGGDIEIGIAAPIKSVKIWVGVDERAAEHLYLSAMRMAGQSQLGAVLSGEWEKGRMM